MSTKRTSDKGKSRMVLRQCLGKNQACEGWREAARRCGESQKVL